MDDEAAKRIDVVVAEQLGVSRSFAQHLINEGNVKVNHKTVRSSYRFNATDTLDVSYDPKASSQLVQPDIPIIYEDDYCVVINKPAGVLSHSKGAFNPEPTVATWLQRHLADDWRLDTGDNQVNRLGIVHRLDRGTSGVMICAKNESAHKWLQKQFSNRKVKKTYYALISGTITPHHAIIDMPIERNPNKPQTFRVGAAGKPAITEYKVIEQSPLYSLLELKPTTGRTHQLRVHLAHLKHPIVGDAFYGGQQANRLYLHAHNLELTLPNRTRQSFSTELPKEFNQILTLK